MPEPSMLVHPCPGIRGTLRVPGDKSISHRAAMLAGFAEGESRLDGFLDSEDCLATLNAMAVLGAGVERDGTRVRVRGTGGRFRPPGAPLDLGNSGTGLRLLAGLLAGQPFAVELTGDASLRSRPMQRIATPLAAMGARVELLGPGGCAPLRVGGGPLQGLAYRLPVASAQVKSCVLLAGLSAAGPTRVEEPAATRDHTERLLQAMGIPVRVDGLTVTLDADGACPRSVALDIPGDFSSAAFWFVAAACRRGSAVTVESVGLNPRRTALLDVLRRMGASVTVRHAESSGGEPMGAVRVDGARLRGTEVGGGEIPNLIDELPLVAVLGACAEGETVIRDAAELRVKESDRIATMAALLRAVGVAVEEAPDGMRIRGGLVYGNTDVHSRGDHRIAMCGAILGLMADGPIGIHDTACIHTSYPGFRDALATVTRMESGEGECLP